MTETNLKVSENQIVSVYVWYVEQEQSKSVTGGRMGS